MVLSKNKKYAKCDNFLNTLSRANSIMQKSMQNVNAKIMLPFVQDFSLSYKNSKSNDLK